MSFLTPGSIEEQATRALQFLSKTVLTRKLDARLQDLCFKVIEDPNFFTAPGGSAHHHNYKHGLIIHTAEVLHNVEHMSDNVSLELLVATVWHDYMKTRDYALNADGTVQVLPYKKLINHLPGSAMEFYHYAKNKNFDTRFIESVLHIMLSHHGRKEWGAAIEPATKEAWALHSADMLSSRGMVYE